MISRTHTQIGVTRTAWFSECERYRYALLIRWDESLKPKCFIGLNPSTATELQDDPTVRRCIDYARRWSCGGLLMLNACAYRSTDPQNMLSFSGDKIGPENSVSWLEWMITNLETGPPVAAWGKHAKKVEIPTLGSRLAYPLNRADELRVCMGPMDCLGTNKDGTPVHPLYQRADLTPIRFNY